MRGGGSSCCGRRFARHELCWASPAVRPVRSAKLMVDTRLIRAQGSRLAQRPASAGLALTPSTDQALPRLDNQDEGRARAEGGGSGAVLEAPAFVAGLDDVAVVGEAIEPPVQIGLVDSERATIWLAPPLLIST